MELKKIGSSLTSFFRFFGEGSFWVYFGGFLLLVFSIFFFAYHLAYARKVVPGVHMAGLDLSNKSEEAALDLLEPRFVALESTRLQVAFGDRKFSKSMYEWGIRYQANSSAQRVFSFGRTGNVLQTTREKLRAGMGGVYLVPVVSLDEEVFALSFSEVNAAIEDPVANPHFDLVDDSLEIVPGKKGRAVDESAFQNLLLESAKEFEFSSKNLPVKDLEPKYGSSQLEEVRERVSVLIESSPELTFGGRSWVLTEEQVLDLLGFEVASDSPEKLEITVDSGELNSFVSSLASSINRPMRGGTFRLQDGRVIDFALPEQGYQLKEEQAKQLITQVVLDVSKEQVELPVEVRDVQEDANQYGIHSLLAKGSSNFRGSSAGRIHNIDLSSYRLDGILVPPGETFSFNTMLGEVSAETGYKTSYVIKGGRTILGVGGGVCQVSTTLFRAVLNAGLSIVERAAHAYRVHYYEQDKGPGFDATVYSPSPDLKFKNDTSAHILIKRNYDPSTSTLEFLIYGTNDGRNVNIVGPMIHSQTPPPEPQYIEDESLAPGETEQIDWAAWGAKVTVERKVTRGGEVLHEDTFYSSYQPWRDVYLVGKE